MATSQYSILRQYTPYTSPYNIDLIKDVMTYKQGQVDANRAKMSQQMDYLMGQQIDKAESREYLQNRMMNVVNRVNDMYRGADLSSDGIVRHIQGEISSVLDSTVVNAIAGTKEGRRMQAYLNDLSLNHPEQYSAANAYVAMMPYYSWLNDGKAGSRLNPLNYTPYVDYNKELNDVMTQMQKTAGEGKKVTMPQFDKDGNPTGAMIEYNINAMTPQQVAAIAKMSMSPKAKAQMSIDAAYMADTNPDMFSYDSYRAYMGQQVEGQQRYVDALEAELMGVGANDIKRQQLNEEIKRAKSGLVSMRTDMDIDPNSYSPYMGANAVVQNNFINGAAQRWSYDKSSYEIKSDPVYWKNLEVSDRRRHNMEMEKIQWYTAETSRLNFKLNEFIAGTDYDIKKFEAENKYELGQYDAVTRRLRAENYLPGGRGVGAGRGYTGGQRSTTPKIPTTSTFIELPIDTSQNIDFTSKINEDYMNKLRKRDSAYSRCISAIPEDMMSKINSYIAERRKDQTSGYIGLSDMQAFRKYVTENGGMTNEIFNIRGRVGTAIRNEYLNFLKGEEVMNEFNDREIARRDLYRERVSTTINESINKVRNSRLDKDLSHKDNFLDIISPYVAESLLRLGKDSFVKEGVLSFSSGEAQELANDMSVVFEAAWPGIFGKKLDKKIEVDDIMSFDPKSKRWVISEDEINNPNSPISTIFKHIMVGDPKEMKISDSKMKTIKATLDYNGFYSPEYTDRQTEMDSKFYKLTSIGGRVYSSTMDENDPEYGRMKTLRDIFDARSTDFPKTKSGTAAPITGYQLMPGGTDESGNKQIMVRALYRGKDAGEKVYAVPITASELEQAGIDLSKAFNDVSIGEYNSGIIPVSYSDGNNRDYKDLAESRNINLNLLTVKGARNTIKENINLAFPSGADASAETSEANSVLNQALDVIIDNYSKFAIGAEGFDLTTSHSVGYDLNLYRLNKSNKNGKPELLYTETYKGVEFADELNIDLNVSPQASFTSMIAKVFAEEIDEMRREGRSDINKDGVLYKIINSIKE